MKLNFFKRLSSKLYTIVPLIIMMGAVAECVSDSIEENLGHNPPKDPFAQTNTGRNIWAYKIGETECVGWWRNHLTCKRDFKEDVNNFTISIRYSKLAVRSEEMFAIGEKYSVCDTLAVTGEPAFYIEYDTYSSISGCFEFRYFQDGIAAGNFEAVVVNNVEPFDTLRIKDGTFDVTYEVLTNDDVSD